MVLFEIAEREEPYAGEDPIKVAIGIRDHSRNPMADMKSSPPEWMLEVMRMCFERDPDERPSFSRILDFLERHKPAGYVDEKVAIVELPVGRAELTRGGTRYLPIQSAPSTGPPDNVPPSRGRADTDSALSVEMSEI